MIKVVPYIKNKQMILISYSKNNCIVANEKKYGKETQEL
jgi:hypothetical protein